MIKSRIKHFLHKYKNKNKYILDQEDRKITENIVNLHYWSYSKDKKTQNLGDNLSVIVVNYMLDKKGIKSDKKVSQTKHLYAIGSILQNGMSDSVVWGSGYLNKQNSIILRLGILKYFRKLDVRAVRGPETRKELLKGGYFVPEIYGDPAILMPLIYKPQKNTEKAKKYSIIKHYSDHTNCENAISILAKDYAWVIDEIVSSEKIISSSLHGIILAEAYGVPAVLYVPKCMENQLFKFYDYYHGTGRYAFPIATTIDEALNINPIAIPDFAEQRQKLIDSFPYDLWEI